MNIVLLTWLGLSVFNLILQRPHLNKMYEESTVRNIVSLEGFKKLAIFAAIVFAPIVALFIIKDFFAKSEGEK